MKRRRNLIQRALGARLEARAEALKADLGEGYDCFGASADGTGVALALTRPLYERWFRVESRGAHHVPSEGPVIVAANHSGTLPFDAMMLHADLLRRTDPPRLPRSVVDRFVPRLPWFSTLVARAGAINGTRRNVEHVLATGQLLVVFPEGTVGIGKPFAERYRLQPWRPGHAELALRHRAPVVPTAIVGAEEQLPIIARIDRFHAFGAPYLPVPLFPFPLPVHYHVRYGEPLALHAAARPRHPLQQREGLAERLAHRELAPQGASADASPNGEWLLRLLQCGRERRQSSSRPQNSTSVCGSRRLLDLLRCAPAVTQRATS